MNSRSIFEDLDFRLAGASWQDSLLQSYRAVHLTLQSIFLAIGVGLTVAISSASTKRIAISYCGELVIFALLATFIVVKMRKLILSRGEDVTYWHMLIVRGEQELPPAQRHFTKFKIHQQAKKAGVERLEELFLNAPRNLTDKEIRELVGTGLSRIRELLDVWLFFALLSIWIILSLIGVTHTVLQVLS